MHLVFPAIPGNIGRIFSVGRDSGRSDSDRCSASDAEPESHKKTQQKIGQIRVKQRCVVFLFFSRGCGCFLGVVITDQYGRSTPKITYGDFHHLLSSWCFLVFLCGHDPQQPHCSVLGRRDIQIPTLRPSLLRAISSDAPPESLEPESHRATVVYVSFVKLSREHDCFICQVESWTRWKHLAQSADWLHDMIFDIQLDVRPWK